MKIISLVRQKLNGVLLYREVIPHAYMVGRYDVHIHFRDNILTITDEELETYDILHSSYSFMNDFQKERLKRLNVKLIIDVDDYWMVDRFHELYNIYKEDDRTKIIRDIMRSADAITTTTSVLAEKIKPYCDKVGVFTNTLQKDDYSNNRVNEVPYMAWIGGGNHTADLMLIQHLQKGIKVPVYVPENYRKVFRDRFLYYPGQSIPEYLGVYNHYDIILISLRKSLFNSLKSPLKLMEAAFFRKPVIVSDVMPFSPYLKHKENCLVVRKKSEWVKWSKMLINDEAMRKELGENLYKLVDEHFNIDKITKKRVDFYKSVINNT